MNLAAQRSKVTLPELVESPKLRYTLSRTGKGLLMVKVQKVSTREFKEEAMRLVQTSGKPITHIARELGISDARVHQWRKELTQHGTAAFPGSGHQTALEEENRRRVSRAGASATGAR